MGFNEPKNPITLIGLVLPRLYADQNQSAIMEARDEGSLMERSDLDELLSQPVYGDDYKL